MLAKSYSFTFFSSYCKFMSHVRSVSSSSLFWVDLCENDTVFWVNDLKDVNCRFWVDRRAVILSFSNNSSRSTALWKDELMMMTTFFFETSSSDRICSHLWLAEFQCSKKYSTLVKKHDFQHFFVSELSANSISARLIDSEQIARSLVYVILTEYVNQCKSSDHDLSSN
jgi:cyanate permease